MIQLGPRKPIEVAVAARYLVEEYPRPTVKLYDLGDRSPRDKVTTDDIGRMVVFAARLDYKRAVRYLDGPLAPAWPSKSDKSMKLEADPGLADDEWLGSDRVTQAYDLFRSINGTGTHYAQTSKLLHLKWPAFYPIVDSRLRETFGNTILELFNDNRRQLEQKRPLKRWGRVDVRAYWLAFRHDLIDNQERGALAALRAAIESHPVETKADREHRDNLGRVLDLRLLDMLAWSHLGTE